MALNKTRVQTPEQALAYLTDCTLATVELLAGKKTRTKHEFDRQINLAQAGIDWMREMGVDFKGTRAEEVVKRYEGSVKLWASYRMAGCQ